MLSSRGRLKRGLLSTGLATVALAVFGVASAAATVTTSSITPSNVAIGTTPFSTNPFYYVYDNDLGGYNSGSTNQPNMTISGTSNGTTGDNVNIMCLYNSDGSSDNDGNLNSAPIPVNADGTFSWTGTLPDQDWSCRLAAVPSPGGVPGNPGLFQGPVMGVSYQQTSQDGSSNVFDYRNEVAQTKVWNEVESVGDCGLAGGYTTGSIPGWTYNGIEPWDCGASLYGDDGISRSEIQVNGLNAYDGYQASASGMDLYSGSETPSDRADVTVTRTFDAATGNTTIVERENLVECQASPDPYPANSGNCGGTKASGVQLTRTITTSSDGQIVTFADKYSSVDGASHPISLEYDNYGSEDGNPVFQFPGNNSFQFYEAGDQLSLGSSSVGTIYLQDADASNYLGDYYSTPASVTFTTQPNAARFTSGSDFLLGYERTVPAGGSVTITHVYATSNDLSTTQALAQFVEDSVSTPTVAITSPATGTVVSTPTVSVAGTASDIHGVHSLTVNGLPVSVNSDGGWSATVPLHTGANTITAVATNQAGVSAQAAETVVYSPPNAAASFCIVPNVSHMKLAKAKKALKAAGCKVGKIHKVNSTVKKGHVVHASYSTNVVLRRGSKVGLTVSKGKSHHKKHNVRVLAPALLRNRRS